MRSPATASATRRPGQGSYSSAPPAAGDVVVTREVSLYDAIEHLSLAQVLEIAARQGQQQ